MPEVPAVPEVPEDPFAPPVIVCTSPVDES